MLSTTTEAPRVVNPHTRDFALISKAPTMIILLLYNLVGEALAGFHTLETRNVTQNNSKKEVIST